MDLRILFFLGAIFIMTSCGNIDGSSDEIKSGKGLYTLHCASCHGIDGKLGLSGAADLSKSKLTANEILVILENGRNGMPALKAILQTKAKIDSVSTYTIELRK